MKNQRFQNSLHHLLYKDYQINDQECIWTLKEEDINNEESIGNYTFITIDDKMKKKIASNVCNYVKLEYESYLNE